MSKEQIAAKIADEVFKSDDFRRLREYELLKIAALKALEHQGARVQELEEQAQADMKFQDGLSERIKDLTFENERLREERDLYLSIVKGEFEKFRFNDADGVRKPYESAMYHAGVAIRNAFGDKALRGEEE